MPHIKSKIEIGFTVPSNWNSPYLDDAGNCMGKKLISRKILVIKGNREIHKAVLFFFFPKR